MGYAGGASKNPSYHSLGGHSETIQIEYDPTQISYEELLEVFWDSHNPGLESYSRQYMSIIFYHNEEQKRLAIETRDQQAAERGAIFTEIVPAGEFTLAEDYHQKYMLRNVPELLEELTAIYPDEADFVNSTAVARVNGYLGGNGSPEQLQDELERLGLSPEGQEWLLERVSP